jgi:hypothetical protein
VWLIGCVVALAIYGFPDVLDVESVYDVVFVPLDLILSTLWATFPFILVSIAILEAHIGARTAVIATVVATAALLIVPRAVERSIEDDPSSTASLLHIYDPVLMALPVGAVIGISMLLAKRRGRQ